MTNRKILDQLISDSLGEAQELRDIIEPTDPDSVKTAALELADFFEQQEQARAAKIAKLQARL